MPLWSRITELLGQSPRGEWVQAGTETDFFVAQSAQRIEFKPGVTVTRQTRPDGGVALLVATAGGLGLRMDCRCPKGYSGECGTSYTEGGPIANCEGTCKHDELDNQTIPCGWFAGPQPKASLFGRLAGRQR
jgi:hypothetical protein